MQSCGGEACQGSSSNLDDHEVSNISPGSTILMLVYGVENNWRNGNHHSFDPWMGGRTCTECACLR